jgi:hypothetical protein
MEILLGNFSAKVGRVDIFKPTGNERLHEISNDTGVGVVNSATSKNLILKSTIFPHSNILHLLGHLLVERPIIKLTIF